MLHNLLSYLDGADVDSLATSSSSLYALVGHRRPSCHADLLVLDCCRATVFSTAAGGQRERKRELLNADVVLKRFTIKALVISRASIEKPVNAQLDLSRLSILFVSRTHQLFWFPCDGKLDGLLVGHHNILPEGAAEQLLVKHLHTYYRHTTYFFPPFILTHQT